MKLISGLFSTKKPLVTSVKDIVIKAPLISIICLFIAFFPIGIAYLGMWVTQLFTGQENFNEGNCGWVALPFLCIATIPVAVFLFAIFMLRVIRETRMNVFKK